MVAYLKKCQGPVDFKLLVFYLCVLCNAFAPVHNLGYFYLKTESHVPYYMNGVIFSFLLLCESFQITKVITSWNIILVQFFSFIYPIWN